MAAVQGIEWIVVGVIMIVLLIFGPKWIPSVARSWGRAIGEVRRAWRDRSP